MVLLLGGSIVAIVNTTFGAGGVHTDPYAFWVWLIANDNPMLNDYVVTQVGHSTMSGQLSTLGGLNSAAHAITFICPFADSHQGDPTKGFKLTCPAGTGGLWMRSDLGNTGTYTVDGIWIDVSAVNDTALLLQSVNGGMNVAKNCLVKCYAGLDVSGVVIANDDTSKVVVSNMKIWNAGGEGFGWHGSVPGGVVGEKIIENITIWDCAKMASPAYAAFSAWIDGCTIRNVVVAKSGKNFNIHPGNLYINCADHDGTLTGVGVTDPTHGVVDTDEFQSVAEANAKFLFLKNGAFGADFVGTPLAGNRPLSVVFTDLSGYVYAASKLSDSGIVPVSAGATDIAGADRPNDGDGYAIGCHEAAIV